MKIKHKFTFTPKNRSNNIISEKSSASINQLNIKQLEEPKEESFCFLSPRKSKKIKIEDDDDIYKTEMSNKKPIELFKEIATELSENNKTLEKKEKNNINNYDYDNKILDKSNISGSFSNIMKTQNNSNDKIDETNNSTVKYNTTNTIEDSKINNQRKDLDKLKKFCESMINRKKTSKITSKHDLFNKSKKIDIENINNTNDLENDINNNDKIKRHKSFENNFLNNHILFFKNLYSKKTSFNCSNIKTKLIKRTPRNETYILTNEKISDINNNDNKNKIKNMASKISFEDSFFYCNKSNIKLKSAFNTSRTYSLINKKPTFSNNQYSLYKNSIKKKNINSNKSLTFSKFIYKKRIIKKDITDENKYYNKNNNDILKNNQLVAKSFRKDKDIINSFRLNIKLIKRKETKKEEQKSSKKEKPVNLKNNCFYSNIYESLIKRQKENSKNNIIIQNFNNYNLNTYNSNRNINHNFINFDIFNKNHTEEEAMNKTNHNVKNNIKNVILDIKINRKCFAKNEEKKY